MSLRSVNLVPSLLAVALDKITERPNNHIEDMRILPKHLKDRLRFILLKRGSMTSECFEQLIHRDVRNLDLSEIDVMDRHLRAIQLVRPMLIKVNFNHGGRLPVQYHDRYLHDAIKTLPYLQVLYLRKNNPSVTDHVLEAVASTCKHLRELDLGLCTYVSDRGLSALSQGCTNLRSVNLCKTSITDQGLACLSRGGCNSTLTELRIDGCQQIGDDGIEAVLAFCLQLRVFVFHGCPQVTDRARLALENFLLEHQVAMKQLTWTVY